MANVDKFHTVPWHFFGTLLWFTSHKKSSIYTMTSLFNKTWQFLIFLYQAKFAMANIFLHAMAVLLNITWPILFFLFIHHANLPWKLNMCCRPWQIKMFCHGNFYTPIKTCHGNF